MKWQGVCFGFRSLTCLTAFDGELDSAFSSAFHRHNFLFKIYSLFKELYILTEMETFAKEPEFLKLLRELKSMPVRRYKKSPLAFVVCS